MSDILWLLLTPWCPLVGGGALLLGGRHGNPLAGVSAVALTGATTVFALLTWITRAHAAWPWLPLARMHLPLSLDAAGANAPLTVLVGVIGLAVMVYAHGYLSRQDARARFFGFMLLFIGAMQWLILADDLLTLLIGWEIVGMCSYALIGFWYVEPMRIQAAQRAFVTTRSADLGLYVAAMAAFAGSSSFALGALPGLAAPLRALAAAGLIAAAAGKSAQLPFSGWLSGAMQGPSPVSALLHSATMVAAGAILLIKVQALLAATGWASPVVLWLGVATALAGALIALYEDTLKQVLAASTVSQYGYIFAALGAGGVSAATTHLLNHAAFKSLLFLGAGVLVHQGMEKFQQMGGLARRLPRLAVLFGAGVLALAALPPMGGFFSKDILLERVEEISIPAYVTLLVAAFITAAYAVRAWLAIFAPSPRTGGSHEPSRPGPLWWLPMAVLALLALGFALLALPPADRLWSAALGAHAAPALSSSAALISLTVALAGAAFAWQRYRADALVPLRLGRARTETAAGIHWLGLIRFLDITAATTLALARRCARFDQQLLASQGIGGIRRGTEMLAWGSLRGDARVVDGVISMLTSGAERLSGRLSKLQSGLLHHYYMLAALGTAALLAVTFFSLGG